ncbi:MAG TPA: hypothetical protein VMA83_06745 [Solirubrobacteraceae bacterium]|nr:hypothetical protein [Solirubrobacteraceae bacterium]
MIAGGAASAGVAAARDGRARLAMRVVEVRPTTRAGALKDDYHVLASLRAPEIEEAPNHGDGCQSGSELLAGELFTCIAPKRIRDLIIEPCWPGSERRTVYCLLEPWRHGVYEVTAEHPVVYEPKRWESSERPRPWALETTTGKRCERYRGTGAVWKGRWREHRVEYICQGGVVGLLSRPERTPGLWLDREVLAARGFGTWRAGPERRIRTAWYGLAHGAKRPPH